MPLLRATVTEDVAPERLDRVALALFEVLASGAQVRKLARKGKVRLDGQPVPPMSTARPGQLLEIELPEPTQAPLPLELDLVYVDDWLAVVDKPAGLVTSGPRRRTLTAALAHALPPSPLPDAMARPHPVHRLDARTRGLVVVARTHAANVALGRAFQERRVQKRYRALLRGALAGQGVVDQPLDGRPAVTRWASVEVSPAPLTGHLSTVDLWPETGRQHQLRRHMAALGHPVLGDERYTTDGPVLRGQGLMLAAVALTLPHPATGQPLTVELPEPAKLATFRERARRRAARRPADTWVFGYGSLVWRPGFPFVQARPGRVLGQARRFWQGSTDHRGLPGAPGRVVTLVPDPTASVVGIAYQVAPDDVEEVLARLDHREQGGYDRLELTVQLLDGGSLEGVLAWVAVPGNKNWLGPASEEAIAATVRRAAGPSGPNLEYVRELRAAMVRLGEHDPHLEAIHDRLGDG